jgi:hypothetical protein
MAGSYGVHYGGSAAGFSRSTGQYKVCAELLNPLDPSTSFGLSCAQKNHTLMSKADKFVLKHRTHK